MKTINLFATQMLVVLVLLNVSGCGSARTETSQAPNTVEASKPVKTEISREVLIERLGKKGVQIKTEAEKEDFPKPNPLLLVVTISQGGSAAKYLLNRDGELTSEQLTKKLVEIFKMREKEGAFRPGSNEVEKTITLSASPKEIADYKAKNIQVEDFENLVDQLKSAGAEPVVLDFTLQLDVAEIELDEIPPPTNPNKTPAAGKTKPGQTISGGVLNGKAIEPIKPVYSEQAKAAKASGVVNVEVVIDETGNVISAKAVSGHDLLRKSAETAVKEAKFTPTTADGNPVNVSGIVVVNFKLPE